MNCLQLFRLRTLSVPRIYTARYVSQNSQHPQRFIEIQDWWREKDGISKKYQLIYKAPMERLLNYATTYLTMSTGMIGGAAAYYAAFTFDPAELNTPIVLGDNVVIADSALECFTYVGAFIAFHAAIKILLSKYVIRLYQDGDNYIAVFRGHFFNSIKKHEFHLNNFKKLKPTFVVTWGDSRFGLAGKHAIILENYFRTPEYFNYLLYKKKAENSSMDD